MSLWRQKILIWKLEHTKKKESSVQFISIIHHIAWNQGCRVTILDLSHGCDEDKGSAWSHHGGATQWGNVSFYYVLSGNLPLRFAVWKACVGARRGCDPGRLGLKLSLWICDKKKWIINSTYVQMWMQPRLITYNLREMMCATMPPPFPVI